MILKAAKLRFRRSLRMQKRQVEELGMQAEQHLERNFFKRLERLGAVKGFVASWVLLLGLLAGCVIAQMRGLSAYYQDISPAPGGVYTEGVLGQFTNANPIYATGVADTTVAELVFSGLLTYDDNNNIVGDLAESWTLDDRETTYTVKLRPGLTWHDGKPLTADDVVFTYHVIQNPDAQSPLGNSWRGITVKAIDPRTVQFTLPSALSAFPQSLTNGIIPKHILEGITMAGLRTAPFNTSQLVGSGPFSFKALEVNGKSTETREERIALAPFEQYHHGKPKLDSFVVRTFRSQDRLIASYKDQEINAIVGLARLPEELENTKNLYAYSLPMTAQVMSFFKTSQGVLKDPSVRQALVRATDTQAILQDLGYPTRPVTQPFLMGQLGYNPAYSQAGFNLKEAESRLHKAGWRPGKDGIRQKNGQPLAFNLVAQDSAEYASVAKILADQWRKVGANVELILRDSDEFQAALAGHSYDALLYGISIGPDPDVFVYWDSTQFDARSPKLNFSEYNSSMADTALESGRTRSDRALRVIKYEPFLRAWRDDAPAVGLYQPRFFYVTRGAVYGLSERIINTDVDRFKNVHNWMIRTVRVSQQ